MMAPDLRPRVLAAQLRRFFHSLGFVFRPWLWKYRSCCNWDYTACTPDHNYKPRKMLITCYCGKEFYRDPEFTLEREEEMRRIFNQ